MLEAFWIPLLPPFFLGLLLSWAVECLLLPRPAAPWRRPWAANFTHLGVWLIAFALELALFRRPYFAVANVLTIQLVIILVSRAKYQALQEPFVYPDFEYFTDAIKHPRLYLPFFGWGNALTAASSYGLALWVGLRLEESLTAGAGIWLKSPVDLPRKSLLDLAAPVPSLYMHTVAMASLGVVIAICAGRRLMVDFDAEGDLKQLGLAGALWAYARAEREPADALRKRARFHRDDSIVTLPPELPNLISVQSESFFDVRRAYAVVKRDILRGFDELCAEAVAFGELNVAARGANTVRTEFAFLSGMTAQMLGIHHYNPYRRLASQRIPTLASYLKALGYRTVCVHPYHGEFYRRDKVLPALGFDEFIDIKAFGGAERVGAYVGDGALADYVIDLLNRREKQKPIYVHVITMENHGPLHREHITDECISTVLNDPLPEGCTDLIAYARHIRNADMMFSKLKAYLQNSPRSAGLCVYGDHIPIMPRVYRALGEVDGRTDYLIWRNGRQEQAVRAEMDISDLAVEFLGANGIKISLKQPMFNQ